MSGPERSAKVYRPPAVDAYHTDGVIDIKRLAGCIRRDRLALKLSWPDYAARMGVPLATIYKIARGDTKHPHELTIQIITERWEADNGGAARGSDVVPA